MTVDGIPNVRVCTTPATDGAVVAGQNFRGSLERDLMQVTDKLGGPFTPPGFYYKTFIRPRKAWPLYEKFLRSAAGLGPLDPKGERDYRVDVENRHVDVLVIGGGQAGLAAAIEHASQGKHVTVVDEGPEAGGSSLADPGASAVVAELRERAAAAGVEVIAPAIAIGLFEYNFVPVAVGNLLLKFRATTVVVASGVVEQPLVFPGNDLIGVVLPEAARRLVNYWSIKPAERAVVITADDRGLAAAEDLRAAGVEVPLVLDLRDGQPPNIEAHGHKGRVGDVSVNGTVTKCDMLVMSGSPQPNYKLLAQAGARVEYDPARGIFVPVSLPANVEAVGAVAGDVGEPAVPLPVLGHHGDKCFVCFCEDQTTKDLKYAIEEGFDSIELSKRYTTVTMGPCQGRLCSTNSIRVYAKTKGVDENTIGTTTSRPPYTPVPMGLVAGYPQEPGKRTSLHHRHKDLGGKMMWTGAWRRPHSYSAGRRRRGAERPRERGPDRRLHARQDPRQGPRRGCVPRPRLPEPVLRPQGRAGPVRRAHRRRRADHGRRHRRPARRRDVLRDDELDRSGRRLPVVHVVERGVVHGRPVRAADRRGRRDQRRRAEGPGADAAPLRRRLLERGARPTSTRSRSRSPASRRSRCASASSASWATSSTCRARSPSTSGTRSSSTARTSASRRSGSSRSASSASRRAT